MKGEQRKRQREMAAAIGELLSAYDADAVFKELDEFFSGVEAEGGAQSTGEEKTL